MPHQAHRAGIQPFDKGDHVVDVLRDRIGVADAVPMLRKKVPQGHRDQPMLSRQGAEHRRPDAEVAQRAVHAHQRRALANIEIGHVVSVDAEGLHGGLARNGAGRSWASHDSMEIAGCPFHKVWAKEPWTSYAGLTRVSISLWQEASLEGDGSPGQALTNPRTDPRVFRGTPPVPLGIRVDSNNFQA